MCSVKLNVCLINIIYLVEINYIENVQKKEVGCYIFVYVYECFFCVQGLGVVYKDYIVYKRC